MSTETKLKQNERAKRLRAEAKSMQNVVNIPSAPSLHQPSQALYGALPTPAQHQVQITADLQVPGADLSKLNPPLTAKEIHILNMLAPQKRVQWLMERASKPWSQTSAQTTTY